MANRVKTKFSGVYYIEDANNDKVFYIRFKNLNGKDQEIKIGKFSEGIRENIAHQKRIEYITKERLGEKIPHKFASKSKLTLESVFIEYIQSIKSTKTTYENDATYFNLYISHLKDYDISNIESSEFEKIRDALVNERRLANSTINDILATARQVFYYAINKGYYKQTNPLRKVKKLKVDNQKIGFFSNEQADMLLSQFQKTNKLLYNLTVLLLHTGARFSEVASLTWNDVNNNIKSIYFKQTKDGNPRHIAMSERVIEVLKELSAKKSSELIIPSPVTNKQIKQMPKQWQRVVDELIEGNDKAGKARLTIHSLRHTHASWLAIAGLDILHIKEQLGHKDIKTTMRYSHLIPNARHDLTKEVFKKPFGVTHTH